MSPQRIQRKRTKGWKMPENTVYVGRPSRWGNPYGIQTYGHAGAIRRYRDDLADSWAGSKIYDRIRTELAGKNLACWCPLDQPCHADVLLELANR